MGSAEEMSVVAGLYRAMKSVPEGLVTPLQVTCMCVQHVHVGAGPLLHHYRSDPSEWQGEHVWVELISRHQSSRFGSLAHVNKYRTASVCRHIRPDDRRWYEGPPREGR